MFTSLCFKIIAKSLILQSQILSKVKENSRNCTENNGLEEIEKLKNDPKCFQNLILETWF